MSVAEMHLQLVKACRQCQWSYIKAVNTALKGGQAEKTQYKDQKFHREQWIFLIAMINTWMWHDSREQKVILCILIVDTFLIKK